MYPNKEIRKKPTMTRSEYMKWEASLPVNNNKEVKSMNEKKKKETKPKLSPSERAKKSWRDHPESFKRGIAKAKATMKAKAKNNKKGK